MKVNLGVISTVCYFRVQNIMIMPTIALVHVLVIAGVLVAASIQDFIYILLYWVLV